jgi:hypothetical protein
VHNIDALFQVCNERVRRPPPMVLHRVVHLLFRSSTRLARSVRNATDRG